LRIVEHAPYEAIYRGVEGLWYARRFIDDRTLYNIAQFINQTQTGSLFITQVVCTKHIYITLWFLHSRQVIALPFTYKDENGKKK